MPRLLMGVSALAMLILGTSAVTMLDSPPDSAGPPATQGEKEIFQGDEPEVERLQRFEWTNPTHLSAGYFAGGDPSAEATLVPDITTITNAIAASMPDATDAESPKSADTSTTTVVAPPTSSSPQPATTTTTTSTTTTSAGLSNSGQVVVSGESGVVIQGLKISNPDGPCVLIQASSEVVVRDSEIGPCGGRAVEIGGSSTVTLERLTIHDSDSGVYALTSEHVAVVGNTFTNAGRNFVQFDKVTGTGNVISGNSGANSLGGSIAEDFISIYKSSGTSNSPITVTNNSFSNGGPSVSGSGIMVGDYGGSHILVQANTLTNPGQVGIGVAGGTNIRVLGNIVYSATQPWSNVGIYVWNQSGGACGSIEVSGNQVEWYNADGAENPSWDGGNCGTIAGWGNNNWHADLG